MATLRESLDHEPRPLRFGTSGRRGEVIHLTQLEVYINALADVEYLQSLSSDEGGIAAGDPFYFASDLRPSSKHFLPGARARGEIAQAIQCAITDAGMQPIYLGDIPTPALTHYALARRKGSIMVTGSHVPFDWNGYKTNSAIGELLKRDETPIAEQVTRVRRRLYEQSASDSAFGPNGAFRSGHLELPSPDPEAASFYLQRYVRFFADRDLTGMRILVYQHSAVGRDLLVEVLRRLGAEVIPAGRSDTFVPIDTENISDALLAEIQALAEAASTRDGAIDAVVSTDGDSDRPLVLGVDPGTGKVRFYGGDLVGMVVAEYLGADAVVVPISCNDAIDRGPLKMSLEPKTRIGSPYVIAGMRAARVKGKRCVCGWEANGGFLTGSDIVQDGNTLSTLLTRDAFLPILSVLFAARARGSSVAGRFEQLPHRYGKAALLSSFPRRISIRIIGQFSPAFPRIKRVRFEHTDATAHDENGKRLGLSREEDAALWGIRSELQNFFTAKDGFGEIDGLNYTDGVRVFFRNGDVAHIRPSGNADELRIYAVADSQARAEEIARLGVAEPDGILRRLQSAVE